MQTLFNFRSLVNELLEQFNQKHHNQNAVGSQLKYTTEFYCHPARDLFSFSSDRYPINRRNDCHLLAKTFLFFVFAIHLAEKRPKFLAKTFLFWSSGTMAACWNLVRTRCGLLIQKVDDS